MLVLFLDALEFSQLIPTELQLHLHLQTLSHEPVCLAVSPVPHVGFFMHLCHKKITFLLVFLQSSRQCCESLYLYLFLMAHLLHFLFAHTVRVLLSFCLQRRVFLFELLDEQAYSVGQRFILLSEVLDFVVDLRPRLFRLQLHAQLTLYPGQLLLHILLISLLHGCPPLQLLPVLLQLPDALQLRVQLFLLPHELLVEFLGIALQTL